MKKLSLVKYGNEYWVTLADFSETRDTEGYSGSASVKSAVRTFVVKSDPDCYIAFRGETQIKNIVQENKNNPLFNSDDFQGTRTALIKFNMVNSLCERFKVKKEWKEEFTKFINECHDYMSKETKDKEDTTELSGRSTIEMQLRQELARLDKEIEVRQKNREKILAALNAISSLEVEDMQ